MGVGLMTKQEIEKAIENGESVWGLFGGAYEIKLSEHREQFFDRYNNYCYRDKNGEDHCCDLQFLYKTKAEAEHYLHHANVTRTEQLPFYTFSEIAKDEKNFKMGKTYTLIEDKNFVLDINKSYVSQIVLYTGKEKYSWNFNEENFYKAYDECVRLFRGGE